MNYYKVFFEDNIAVAIERLLLVPKDRIELIEVNGKNEVQSIVVTADNGKNAIEEATSVLRRYILPFQT